MSSLIAISLNPNIGFVQGLKAIPYILRNADIEIEAFEKDFGQLHGAPYTAHTFYTGRSAWFAILKALDIRKGDEVLIPAFTCVAVVNPIRWLGAKPVYVDITDDFVMDLEDAERKMSEHTKVILAQHTFGHVVDIERYMDFAKRHTLALVEDCAHALGSTYPDGPRVGTKSIAAFFSFGRDKCLTAYSGGAVLTADASLRQKVKTFQQSLTSPGWLQRMQDVLYPMVIENVYWLYSITPALGKVYHNLLLRSGIIKKANSSKEKRGDVEPQVIKRWATVYARMASEQLGQLDIVTKKRQVFAEQYIEQFGSNDHMQLPSHQKHQTYLRFAVQVADADALRQRMQEAHIFLGDWYDQVVGPRAVDLAAVGYEKGTCPHAEQIVQRVINLPTSPRLRDEDMERVIGILRDSI